MHKRRDDIRRYFRWDLRSNEPDPAAFAAAPTERLETLCHLVNSSVAARMPITV